MSSTNVHSEQESNIQIVGGQVIPTGREMEIPPKSAGKGPSTLDVKQGEAMEISVGTSELHRDGRLVARDGMEVAKFDAKAFSVIAAKHNRTANKVVLRADSSSSKGEDR